MPKRKKASYTVAEKLQAISRIRNGEMQCVVYRDLGIPESTLRGWIRDEDNLRYLPYIALHYLTLPYITLHCLTLPYIALHYITLMCLFLFFLFLSVSERL